MNSYSESEYLATLDSIRDMKIAMKRNSRDRQKLYSRLEVIRAEYIVAIGSEKDDKVKLVFSNERMREAELVLRLNKNSEYTELQKKRWENDEASDDLIAEHNRLTDIKYLHMIKLGIPVEIDEGRDKIIEFH